MHCNLRCKQSNINQMRWAWESKVASLPCRWATIWPAITFLPCEFGNQCQSVLSAESPHVIQSTCREQENVEAMYMRRRFQGLSLEEQRKRQALSRTKKGRFVSRRRSSAAESKPSTTQLATNPRARVIRANPFGLQVCIDGDSLV